MEMCSKMKEGKLEQLPSELLLAILSALPNIQSLISTVLTGPRLYSVFTTNKAQITKEALLRQVHPEHLYDALVAELSGHEKEWGQGEAWEFLEEYVARNEQPFHCSLKWKISHVLPLAQRARDIDFFFEDIASYALARGRPVSENEMNRIIWTLYRFEAYCNMFRDDIEDMLDGQWQKEEYFPRFAPWKNEQLACIHDYLLRIMRPGSTSATPCCFLYAKISNF